MAAQELIRLEIGAKRFAEAEAVGRRGLEIDPANEKLLLAMALLDDVRGRTREARATIERIPRRDQKGAGERSRYGEPPREALARSERELRDSAVPRRDRLASALGLPASPPPAQASEVES